MAAFAGCSYLAGNSVKGKSKPTLIGDVTKQNWSSLSASTAWLNESREALMAALAGCSYLAPDKVRNRHTIHAHTDGECQLKCVEAQGQPQPPQPC